MHDMETEDECSKDHPFGKGYDVFGKVPKHLRDSNNDDDSDSDSDGDSSNGGDSGNESDEDNSDCSMDENIEQKGGYNRKSDPYNVIDKWVVGAYRRHIDEALDMADKLGEKEENLATIKRIVKRKLLPKYRKSFRDIYTDNLLKMDCLKKEPVTRKVLKTAKQLERENGLDRDESIRKAVSERKHLINRFLEEDDDTDSDEEKASDQEDSDDEQ